MWGNGVRVILANPAGGDAADAVAQTLDAFPARIPCMCGVRLRAVEFSAVGGRGFDGIHGEYQYSGDGGGLRRVDGRAFRA